MTAIKTSHAKLSHSLMHTIKMQTNRCWNKKWKWSSRPFKLQIHNGLDSGEMHLLSKSGNPTFNLWWLIGRTSSKWGKFWLWSSIWPWRSRSITPPPPPPPKKKKKKTIGILTKVFYTYGPNLVTLAWTDDELLCGQASDYRTHRRTDGHTDRHRQRQYPKAKTGLG